MFGSAASGTAVVGSDVDLCVETAADPVAFLKKIYRCLLRQGVECEGIFHARVPIVRFKDAERGMHADLSVNDLRVLQKSEFFNSYLAVDPRAAALVRIVKWWAKGARINDAHMGTFNSLTLSILTIFYLQNVTPPILPVLQAKELEGEGWTQVLVRGVDFGFADGSK
jgi:terminal uridylyltransferase